MNKTIKCVINLRCLYFWDLGCDVQFIDQLLLWQFNYSLHTRWSLIFQLIND